MRVLMTIALCAALAGCATRCDQVFDPQKADWCYEESSAVAAHGGDLDLALRLLSRIQSPRVRAVGAERLLAILPSPPELKTAASVCASLSPAWAARCSERLALSFPGGTP